MGQPYLGDRLHLGNGVTQQVGCSTNFGNGGHNHRQRESRASPRRTRGAPVREAAKKVGGQTGGYQQIFVAAVEMVAREVAARKVVASRPTLGAILVPSCHFWHFLTLFWPKKAIQNNRICLHLTTQQLRGRAKK